MITTQDLKNLCSSAKKAGVTVDPNLLNLLIWQAGLQTHVPQSLPKGSSAIYIFKWNNIYLKVGKVNANSNARYLSQHYNPNSSPSNLSKTLLKDQHFSGLIGNSNVGDWLKSNTTRYNILIPSNLGKNFVHFAEAYFILKCSPIFENTRA